MTKVIFFFNADFVFALKKEQPKLFYCIVTQCVRPKKIFAYLDWLMNDRLARSCCNFKKEILTMLRYTIEIHKYYGTLPFVSGMYVPIDICILTFIYLLFRVRAQSFTYLNLLKTGITRYVGNSISLKEYKYIYSLLR